jgi:hypothetical protein
LGAVCPILDFNHDDDINLLDLAEFQNVFNAP